MRRYSLFGLVGALALAQTGAAQSFVDYTGGIYNQTFDSLPFSNNVSVSEANPVTVSGQTYFFNNGSLDFAAAIDSTGPTNSSTGGLGLSSTMSGWYGSGAITTRVGAQLGDQTQGGIISFGGLASGNRALGLESANGSGITTFALKLVNDTGSSISAINLSFVGELWRQATAKTVNFGYVVANTSASLPTSGSTSLGSISFTGGSAGPVDGTLGVNQTNINLTAASISNWGDNQALWLTWQTATAAGSSQGIAIDNLSFSAVPEPSTLALVGLGVLGMLSLRRRQ
ncbi:MAG TPA: PEP-CTERM sorting domain-containing protein [Verrucomicrobiae bacterium]|nr:PEP-CTERM sorting domain-containing protein [Verrucomicrobiae bacterium]